MQGHSAAVDPMPLLPRQCTSGAAGQDQVARPTNCLQRVTSEIRATMRYSLKWVDNYLWQR